MNWTYIKNIPNKGRGVFANNFIAKNDLIEIVPVIVIPKTDVIWKTDDLSILDNYYYLWGNEDTIALALGYGSLYNHSYYPNAVYYKDYNSNLITIQALEDIEIDHEICINYNGDPTDQTPVWFDVE